MKTTIFNFILCLPILLFFSCSESGDDTEDIGETNNPPSNTINVVIDEYPRTGDLITPISSNLTGNLSYSIVFESLPSATNLSTNGLTVLDWLLYDFETIEEFLVDIEVSNGTETEILNYKIIINDVDDIGAFLNGDSITAYNNASNGEWVMVLESEYNDIANYLAETSKSATSDSDLISSANIFNLQSDVTYANETGPAIESGTFLIGFKYYSWSNNAGNTQVKISLGDVNGPYEDVGGKLPNHNSGYNSFVLKGSANRLSTSAYLAVYSSVSMGGKNKNDFDYRRENGNVSTLTGQGNNGFVLYQGLSSSLRQWD